MASDATNNKSNRFILLLSKLDKSSNDHCGELTTLLWPLWWVSMSMTCLTERTGVGPIHKTLHDLTLSVRVNKSSDSAKAELITVTTGSIRGNSTFIQVHCGWAVSHWSLDCRHATSSQGNHCSDQRDIGSTQRNNDSFSNESSVIINSLCIRKSRCFVRFSSQVLSGYAGTLFKLASRIGKISKLWSTGPILWMEFKLHMFCLILF